MSRSMGFDDLLTLVTWTAVQSGEETAMKYHGNWFNLDGDHRTGVLRAFKRSGVVGVLRYFQKNLGDNAWSTGSVQDLKHFIEAES